MQNLPDYVATKQALTSADAVASTSESHGLLTGLFCSGKVNDVTAETWAKSSVGDIEKNQSAMTTLQSLFEVTHQKLETMDFSFELLLPSDDDALDLRAQELGAWCVGFMHGLQLGQVDLSKQYTQDCQDALERITDIAQIDYENVKFEEGDEDSYLNIVEYVRLAVLVVYMEIAKKIVPPTTVGGEDTTIH